MPSSKFIRHPVKRMLDQLSMLSNIRRVLQDHTTNAGKAHFLIDMIEDYPWLSKWLRLIYAGPSEKVAKFLKIVPQNLQPEVQQIVSAIRDRDLDCGLSFTLVNKIFAKCDLSPMTEEKVPLLCKGGYLNHISLEFNGEFKSGTAIADLCYKGEKVASLVLVLGQPMRKTMKLLRQVGVQFYIPPYCDVNEIGGANQ